VKYRPKHIVEYVAVRATACVFSVLPLRIGLCLAWGLAWFVFRLLRWRRNDAESRIREVYGDKYSDREVSRIAWMSMRNLWFCAVETMRGPKMKNDWIDRYAPGARKQMEKLKAETKERGGILALAHSGNWDLSGQAIRLMDVPVLFLMRNQRNPLVNDFLNRMRTAHGGNGIDRDEPGMIRHCLRALKNGTSMAVLIDLRAKTEALEIEWLGKPANLGRGLGLLAYQARATVYPATLRRTSWTQHEWTMLEPIIPNREADKQEEVVRIMETAASLLGPFCLAHPEDYFWYNKRWVLEPLDDD
jgi:KDO2-lipid IV(A) lauroyltransferase